MQLQRRVSLSIPGGGGGGGSDSESEKDPWTTTTPTPRDVISVVSSLSSEEDNAGNGAYEEHEDTTGRARRDSNVSVLSGIVMEDGGGGGGGGGAGIDLGREGSYDILGRT